MATRESPQVGIIENMPFLGRKFAAYLEELDVTYRIVRAWRGARLPTDCGAYILTGDLHNITDSLMDYHRRELDLLEKVAGRRVYASCFSHQLIALQRGGRVERRRKRLLGFEHIRLHGEHRSLVGMNSFTALCLNTDEVSELPKEARLLGTSENCRVQVLAYGEYVLTCQAHPERPAGRNRPGLNLTALLLAGGSPSRFARFRGSLALADDSSSDAFMRGVVNWLLGGSNTAPYTLTSHAQVSRWVQA